jgi:hypothetical protein
MVSAEKTYLLYLVKMAVLLILLCCQGNHIRLYATDLQKMQ